MEGRAVEAATFDMRQNTLSPRPDFV